MSEPGERITAGDDADPFEALREAVAIERERAANAGGPSPELGDVLFQLASRLKAAGRPDEALAPALEAYELLESIGPSAHPGATPARILLGQVIERIQKRESIARQAPGAIEGLRKVVTREPGARPYAYHLLGVLGEAACRLGEMQLAVDLALEAEAVDRNGLPKTAARFELRPAVVGGLLATCTFIDGRATPLTVDLMKATTAVAICRALTETYPGEYQPALAESLRALGVCQVDAHAADAATAAFGEALLLERRLLRDRPERLPHQLAATLESVARHRRREGNFGAAVTLSTKAVEQYRAALARRGGPLYPDPLPPALRLLSDCHNDNGEAAAAVAALSEALALYRSSSYSRRLESQATIADALVQLSYRHRRLPDSAAALSSATEAVRIYRKLVEPGRDRFAAGLAAALNALTLRQCEAGHVEGALATAMEAVQRYRLLHASRPGNASGLGWSLLALARRQFASGDGESARSNLSEAVGLLRDADQAGVAGARASLAEAIALLSDVENDSGELRLAVASLVAGTEVYRELAVENPNRFLPDLGLCLTQLAHRQLRAGIPDAALKSSTEGVPICRDLASSDPERYSRQLGHALRNLANAYEALLEITKCLHASEEATDLFRRQLRSDRIESMEDLAASLHALARRQYQVGRARDGLATATEALDHFQELCRRAPNVGRRERTAHTMTVIAQCQADLGEPSAAVVTTREAIALYSEIVRDCPEREVFASALAWNHRALAHYLRLSGDHEASAQALAECAAHYRRLAERNPGSFGAVFARCLHYLAIEQEFFGDYATAHETRLEAAAHARRMLGPRQGRSGPFGFPRPPLPPSAPRPLRPSAPPALCPSRPQPPPPLRPPAILRIGREPVALPHPSVHSVSLWFVNPSPQGSWGKP